ncbi:hypothetical protein Taro_034305, partial [Colocasia esculenta]|nr:hypothetical protein [Colocasia esculenta]
SAGSSSEQHCSNHELLLFFSNHELLLFFSFFFSLAAPLCSPSGHRSFFSRSSLLLLLPYGDALLHLMQIALFMLSFSSSGIVLALLLLEYEDHGYIYIVPCVHVDPWGAWAQRSRSDPLIPKQTRVQKIHILNRHSKCVDTRFCFATWQLTCVDTYLTYVDTTGFFLLTVFWKQGMCRHTLDLCRHDWLLFSLLLSREQCICRHTLDLCRHNFDKIM